ASVSRPSAGATAGRLSAISGLRPDPPIIQRAFGLNHSDPAKRATPEPGLNEPACAGGGELSVRRLLSERIAVVPTQSSDRRSCDGSDDRAASTDDRRHDGSQPLASNPTILRLRGC